jgi:hypothetical protein
MNTPLTEKPEAKMTPSEAKERLHAINRELLAIRNAFASFGGLSHEAALSERAWDAVGSINACVRAARMAEEHHGH